MQNQAFNEIAQQWLSSKKARTTLGWTAKYDLRRGLTETIAWYRKNFPRG